MSSIPGTPAIHSRPSSPEGTRGLTCAYQARVPTLEGDVAENTREITGSVQAVHAHTPSSTDDRPSG
jgi:hypothetical protein